MNKVLKRILAYYIDIIVVLIITQCISSISLFNPYLDSYQKYYDEYNNLLVDYSTFKNNLDKYYKDTKISNKEYNKLIKETPSYKSVLDKYYTDNKITKTEYNKITKEIDKAYLKDYKRLYYLIEKNSVAYFIIYLVVLAGYFIGFNIITSGVTLGKKILRLKIINIKDEDADVPIWSYLVRFIFLYQPLYYLTRLIGVILLKESTYYNVVSVVYNIHYYLEFIILIFILISIDGRGIHEILSKTRVALYNRSGEEINKKNEDFLSKKVEDKLKKITNKK